MEPNAAFTLVDGHIAVDEDSEPGYADILSLNLESGITSQEERLPIIPSELHNIIDYIGVDKIVRMSKDEVKEATRIGLPKLDQDRLVFVKNHVIPAVAAGSPNRTTLELVLTQALANAIFYEMMKEDSTLASVREIIKQMSGVDLSQPVDLFREYEKDDLEAAFFQTFTDPDDYIEHLKNEIIRSSRSYGEDCYFPGVSIVQTSGSGKSRSIAELSKSFYVVYCSFMRKAWTGFPQRSNIADELLKGNSDFEAYFKACYEVVNRYLRANNGSQRPSEDLSHDFFKQQVRAGTRDLFYEDLERAMRSITNDRSGLSEPGSLKMLFVFDEAHQMRDYQPVPKSTNHTGTAFVRMRRAAAKLFSKQQTQAFIIMMDTTSRISTIGPSAEQDPSMRVVQGLKIFRPLFLIGNFDVGQKSAYGKPLDVALGAGRLFALGRPLWQSLMKDESSKRKVRTLAVLKIEMTKVIAVVSLVAILCVSLVKRKWQVTAMKTPEEIRAGNWSLDDWGKFGPYNAEGEYIDPETECDGQPCPPLLPLGEPHPWKPGPPSPTCIQVTEEIQHCNYLPEGYIDVTYEEFLALEAESLTENHDEEEKKVSTNNSTVSPSLKRRLRRRSQWMLETSPEERILVIWSGAPMTYTIVAVDTLQNSIETAAGIISLSIEGWRTGCNEQEGGFTSKITYTESASLASIWFKLQETTVCGDPSAIACAFFPSDYSRTTNTVLINYPRLVARTLERSVVAMTHELGHVLGLAHKIDAQEAGIWYASAYDSSSIMLPSSLSLSAITENDCLAIKYYNDGFPEVRWCKVVRSGIGRCFNAKLAYSQPSLQSIRLRGNQRSTVVGHDELLLDSDEISCTGADSSLYTLIETDNINFLEGYVYPDFSLYECQGLTTSSSSNYIYVMQSDGNFVSYDLTTGAAIWSTNTGGQGDQGYSIVFQTDGNVVTSSNSGDIIWSSGTYGTSPLTFGLGGEKLYLQSSGHMSIVGGGGITLWSSRDEIVYQDIPLRMSRYGLCLDGAENVSAGLPQLYACNSTPDQMWTVTTLGEIISTQSGLCLMAYPDPLIGAPLVMLLPCDGESASRWNFLSTGEIYNQRFRSCLGATPDNPSSGSELRVSPCSQQGTQLWLRIIANSGSMINSNGMVLDGGAAQQGTTVQLWDYNGSIDQEWSFYTDGLISHKQSGLCLTDSELNSEVYAVLTLERCTTTDNQRWSAQGGTFVNHWSGRCLDNYQSNTQAGNPVGAYPCNNEDSQQWSFE